MKFIKYWISGPLALLAMLGNLIRAPEHWEAIMAVMPSWMTEERIRWAFTILPILYCAWLIWPSRTKPLVIAPLAYDASIVFDKVSLLPKEDHFKPFAFELKNIGDKKITDLNLSFSLVGLDWEDLFQRASRTLPHIQRGDQTRAFITSVVRADGDNSITVELTADSKLKIDVLQPDGEFSRTITLPEPIKRALSLSMILTCEGAQARMLEKAADMIDLAIEDKAGWQDYLHSMAFDCFVPMPPVQVVAIWRQGPKSYKQILLINSVYLSTSGRWVRDEAGGEEYLIASGMLGYQNPNEPNEGHYNRWIAYKDKKREVQRGKNRASKPKLG